MLNIWNKLIQSLVVSESIPNLKLAAALVGKKQIMMWWFLNTVTCKRLNLLRFPFIYHELLDANVWDEECYHKYGPETSYLKLKELYDKHLE